MGNKEKFISADKFNTMLDAGKKELHEARKAGKERKTRKDIITALSGGISLMLDEGMQISDIVHALKKTDIGSVMSEGTMRTYIMQICGKRARKKKTKGTKPVAVKAASIKSATPPATAPTAAAPGVTS